MEVPTDGPSGPSGPTPAEPVLPAKGSWRARLGATTGFRRLLGLRFAAQWADGMFQAALVGALLFNPEREADPLAVAGGFAVLLVPYSVIGPFAGALLDRWDRRQVLLMASLLRALLVGVVALVVAAALDGVALYATALAVAGTSRFILAGLSAALPHVVHRRRLVTANVLAATTGAGMAALGAGSALALRAWLGNDDTGSAVATAAAAIGSLAAAVIALYVRRGLLGPDPEPPHDPAGPPPATEGRTLVAVGRGLAVGARATAATPEVAASFLALGAHRVSFGITVLVMLLLFRHSFSDDGVFRAGLAGVSEAGVLAAAGLALAAPLTPWLTRRFGRARTTRGALVVAVGTQLLLAVLLSAPAVLVTALVIGCAGQVIKLCTDAGIQTEVHDDARGQVFALYDALFNVCFALAVAVAAVLVPLDGRAPWLVGATAGVYLLGLLAHRSVLRR